MHKTLEYGIIFALILVILLLIFLYIHVFVVKNKETKHVTIEDMGVETYIEQAQTKSELIRTYLEPHSDPYFNIAISYNADKPPQGLEFQIFDDQNREVSYRTIVLKETEDYKAIRIYFDNTGSKYYTINYTLPIHDNNLDNIEIVFTELRV